MAAARSGESRCCTVIDVLLQEEGSLVGPAASDIADGVTAATEDQEGQPKALYKFDARAVALEREVEAAQTIARE